MKKSYKKPLIFTGLMLVLLALISFLCVYFININNQSLFCFNGFYFKNNSSITISLNKENKITSKDINNFDDVDINFYVNANYKYEINNVPCDFIDLYDLNSFEKGEGKNINSAFRIEKSKDTITFVKDKTLKEIISFYKGDCSFTNDYSIKVDYYRCELTYKEEVISFTFGEVINGLNLGNTEVIF